MHLQLRAIAALTAATAMLPLLSGPAAAAPAGLPKGTVSAKVVKIVDGDTIDVRRGGKTIRVRLLEVGTPRRGQCWYKTATAHTAALLPVGRTAYLLADKGKKDGTGHSLFYVWNAKGVHVNRNLVRYGYGKALLVKPNDRYIALMRGEQAKAKRERLRVWSGKCDSGSGTPAPTSTPTPAPTKSNPPSGTDQRYRTCGDANAAGHGPYTRGVDPEYAWYQDRDGDGIVCER